MMRLLLLVNAVMAIAIFSEYSHQANASNPVTYAKQGISKLLNSFRGTLPSPVVCKDISKYCSLFHRILKYQCEDQYFGSAIKAACPETCNECGINKGQQIAGSQESDDLQGSKEEEEEPKADSQQKVSEWLSDSMRQKLLSLRETAMMKKSVERAIPSYFDDDEEDGGARRPKPSESGYLDASDGYRDVSSRPSAHVEPQQPVDSEQEAFDVVDKEDPADTDLSELGDPWTDKDEIQQEKLDAVVKQVGGEGSPVKAGEVQGKQVMKNSSPESTQESSEDSEESVDEEDVSPWRDQRIYASPAHQVAVPGRDARRNNDASSRDYGDGYRFQKGGGGGNGGGMNSRPVLYP